jgi:superfamily II DNA or RNA helicase
VTEIVLRPYQDEAIAALDDAVERGIPSGMVALPTGMGKTVVFSKWGVDRWETVLILAHRDELLKQAAEKFEMVEPQTAMSIGFVKAELNEVDKPIIVASVQTLASPARLAQLPKHFDLIVVDEAHHATADSYRMILDGLEADFVAGFTATPERHDDGDLKKVFKEIVYGKSLLEAIEEGWLSNLRGVRVELEDLDLKSVKTTAGEYQTNDLERALNDAHAPEHTAAALLEHAPGRKTIVFVPTVALAKDTAAAICDAGLAADYVIGDNTKRGMDRRRRVLKDFSAGNLDAVVNVDVLTEGFDEPSVDCIAIASPTRSRIKYVQQVGRGTRTYPGKDDCLILDLAGVTDEMDLQSLPNLFDLKEQPRDGETVTDARAREAAEEAESATERERIEADQRKRKARETNLFNRERLHWLDLDGRWALSAGGGDHLVLDPTSDGHFQVMLLMKDRARILARGLDYGYATGAAEDTIRRRGAAALADKEARWRKGPPTDGQRSFMRRLRIIEPVATKGEAADLIDAELVRRRLEKLDAAMARMAA